MSNPLTLRKFDIQGALNQGNNILIVGRRGIGKSQLVRDMLYKGQYYFGTVCTGTVCTIEQYGDLPLDICVYRDADQHVTNYLLDSSCVQDKSTVLVLDDCIDDNSSFTKPVVEALESSGTIIMTTQYPFTVDPSLRIDYVFIFSEPNWSTRQRIWEQYGKMFPKKKEFNLAMDQATGDYSCMVIDCRVHDEPKEITDLVFWYKSS
jgi:hypothetical protein